MIKLILNSLLTGNPLKLCRIYFSNDNANKLRVEFKGGLPHFNIPLPSRNENCLFVLRPMSSNVGDLIDAIKEEDYGVDKVAMYSRDGQKISKSNSLHTMLCNDFDIIINDKKYQVSSEIPEPQLEDNITRINDIKNLITRLSIAVNFNEFNIYKEKDLKNMAELIRKELEPLEQQKIEITEKAALYTRRITWFGLGIMGIQFGLLARLTWWEYSWDVMEPVTYFLGYGTAIAMYAYFIITRQEYCFSKVFDREFLKKFYNMSENSNFDIVRYNKLNDNLARIENDLKRLRDPLLLNLPLQQAREKNRI